MEQYNTHGGYYAPNNLVRINEGGTHEQNPNGGVQYGTDEQGIPNLVEEGENIYNDYVFSDRIKPSKSDLREFGLPEKYAGKTFSEIADKLSEEARERPNDAVSNNGMGAMLDRLMACQEAVKQRREEARMRRELKKMSPEELMALGAGMAQQQQAPVMSQGQMPMQAVQPDLGHGVAQEPQAVPQEAMPVMAAYGGPVRRSREPVTQFVLNQENPPYIDGDAERFAKVLENSKGLYYDLKDMPDYYKYGTGRLLLDNAYQGGDTSRKMVRTMLLQPGDSGPVYRCGGKLVRRLEGGTPGEVVVIPDEYAEEDQTTRAMQHFADRQARNEAIAAGVDRFFNGPGYVPSDSGAIELLNPAGLSTLFKGAKLTHAVRKANRAKGVKTSAATLETVADKIKDVATKTAIKDAAFENAVSSGKTKMAERALSELKELGKEAKDLKALQRKAWLDSKLGIGKGVTVAEQAVQTAGEAATAAEGAETAARTTWQKVRPWLIGGTALGAVGTGVGAAIKEGKERGEVSYEPFVDTTPVDYAEEVTTGNYYAPGYYAEGGPVAYPTGLRYADAVYEPVVAAANAALPSDRIDITPGGPVYASGRLAQAYVPYQPISGQTLVNQVQANNAAAYNAALNSGQAALSPTLLAMQAAGNKGIGAAQQQADMYNNQLLSSVITQNNAAKQAEANFQRDINMLNARLGTENVWRNYNAAVQRAMYNQRKETEKWNAVSQVLDAGIKNLTNIGNENFATNQVNSNRAMLGYWIDDMGWVHYTKPDGTRVTEDPKTGKIITEVKAARQINTPLLPNKVYTTEQVDYLPHYSVPTYWFDDISGKAYMTNV